MSWATRALQWQSEWVKPLGPASKGVGKLRKLCRAWDRSLQLFFLNEECLVDVLHQSTLTTSLPFVHTARRCYRCQLDTGQRTPFPFGVRAKVDPCLTSRGSKSRNKVAVGEPAAGSFRKFSNNEKTSLFTWKAYILAERKKPLISTRSRILLGDEFEHNLQRWMSWLSNRWRTRQHAIIRMNCRIKRIIKPLNATCALGFRSSASTVQCR